jgi:hypothetical protein
MSLENGDLRSIRVRGRETLAQRFPCPQTATRARHPEATPRRGSPSDISGADELPSEPSANAGSGRASTRREPSANAGSDGGSPARRLRRGKLRGRAKASLTMFVGDEEKTSQIVSSRCGGPSMRS